MLKIMLAQSTKAYWRLGRREQKAHGGLFFSFFLTFSFGISSENLLNRPIYAEINTHIFDRILHSTYTFADINESKIALNDQSS